MLVKAKTNKSLKIIFSKNEAIKIFGNNRPDLRDKRIQKIISSLFIVVMGTYIMKIIIIKHMLKQSMIRIMKL